MIIPGNMVISAKNTRSNTIETPPIEYYTWVSLIVIIHGVGLHSNNF